MKSITEIRSAIDKELCALAHAFGFQEDQVVRAAEYALLGKGKRLRGLLVCGVAMDIAPALSGNPSSLITACAVEMLHAASLVHDDLPALDNDDERRGEPSCHRKFSEGSAILAGDLLVGGAFNAIHSGKIEGSLAARIGRCLSNAWMQLCIGQSMDLTMKSAPLVGESAEQMRRLKTGALFGAATAAGALCGGADDAEILRWANWGEEVGVLFQRIDDVLDNENDAWPVGALAEELERLSAKCFPLGASHSAANHAVAILRTFIPQELQASFQLAS